MKARAENQRSDVFIRGKEKPSLNLLIRLKTGGEQTRVDRTSLSGEIGNVGRRGAEWRKEFLYNRITSMNNHDYWSIRLCDGLCQVITRCPWYQTEMYRHFNPTCSHSHPFFSAPSSWEPAADELVDYLSVKEGEYLTETQTWLQTLCTSWMGK